MAGFTGELKKKGSELKVEVFDLGVNGKYVYMPRPLRFYVVNVLGVSDAAAQNYSRNETHLEDEMELYELKVDLSVPLDVLLVLAPEMIRSHRIRDNQHSSMPEEVKFFEELLVVLEEEANNQTLDDVDKTKTSIGKLYKLLNQADKEWVTSDPYADIVFKSSKASIVKTQTGTVFTVTGTVNVVERGSLVSRSVDFQFPYFVGMKPWSEVGIQQLAKDDPRRPYFVERGRKSVQVSAKPSYMMCEGSIVRRLPFGDRKFKARGRVMIDKLGMRESDMDYQSYFGESRRDVIYQLRHTDSVEDMGIKLTEISEDQLICVSPFVYGFSFVSKVWGEILVDFLRPIQFREDTYTQLVLEEETKDLLLTLVENSDEKGLDFIDGKGGGLIFLLNGSSGVGKTLTAEAVAEKLHRPLYTVGVGELGTTTAELEDRLRRILDTAASWDAVLLLDECDIFMEERSDKDIERNAMVGIFLRLLEYYEGVLFLTSNRAHCIDEAFYSRISMSIHYPNLTYASRAQIWHGLLQLYNVHEINIDELAKFELNGRHIKGILRIISAISKSKGIKPTTDDFINIINKEQAFKRYAQSLPNHTLKNK